MIAQCKSDIATQESLASKKKKEWSEVEATVDQLSASVDALESEVSIHRGERDRILKETQQLHSSMEEAQFCRGSLSGRLVLLENELSEAGMKEAEHRREMERIQETADAKIAEALIAWENKLEAAIVEWEAEMEPWEKEEKNLDDKLEGTPSSTPSSINYWIMLTISYPRKAC